MSRRLSLPILVALATLAAAPARAGESRGPRFGNATISSAIRTAESEADEDVFVESLAIGETLQVRVRAAKGSSLRPVLVVEGPDGQPRDVDVKVKGDGRALSTASLPVDATGRWTVRIAGDAATEGAYSARFRIGKARARIWKGVAVPAPGQATLVHPFDAVEGALADVKVTSAKGGAIAQLLRVLDPGRGSVPGSQDAVKARKAKATVSGLPLRDGDGDYALLLASPDGPATVTVKIRTRPPAGRPRGKVAVSADEPWLAPLDEPLEGEPGKSISLRGARFPASPLPEVWFGELKGSVVAVRDGGSRIDVVTPSAAPGTVVDVAVVTAEGQCAQRASYFGYLERSDPVEPPPTLALSALDPAALDIEGGTTRLFDVVLSEAAPSGGVYVTLEATGGIGQVAPEVRVPAGRTTASFLFGAVNADRTGAVRATLGSSVVSAAVTVHEKLVVEPPAVDEVDLTGWTIVQTASSRSFTIPNGTKLRAGQVLVLARNATESAFEAFWGVTLGADVVYLSSTDYVGVELPTINGDEVYDLLDAFGDAVDGPTFALSSSAGQNLQRVPGSPASSASSWSISTSIAAVATPGTIDGSTSGHGVFLSEISDAAGAGNYVFEFVEIAYDGAPAE